MTTAENNETDKITIARRCLRAARRLLLMLLAAIVLFGLLILIGMIPVNNDFQPTLDGIEITLISNPVHADIVVPIETSVINWREHFPGDAFKGDTGQATHVAIGWGDKGFFLETPTWADLKISTAAHALFWPSGTCLHVVMLDSNHFENSRSVKISIEQYKRLVDFIKSSFKTDAGEKIRIIGEAYSIDDAFYEANGTYHFLNTCNSWVGRAIRSAGVRCGWMTPLPKTTFLYLPN